MKPVVKIATLTPRVQVQAGLAAQTGGRLFVTETNVLARRVMVKVKEPVSGALVFKHGEPVTVEPEGEPVTVGLQLVEPRPELAYGRHCWCKCSMLTTKKSSPASPLR